jgi:UDP-N-acetylglucosamine--dolichyl-phosphate N-acetylglucosaminephosphotransferase
MDFSTILIFTISGFIALVMSFILTRTLIPILIRRNIVNNDLNKLDEPLIPEMGGIGVILAFFFAMNFSLIWIDSSKFEFSALAFFIIMGVAFVGIMDDLLDLHHLTKGILPFIIAIPLGIGINNISITVPFFGSVDLGWWTILLVPVGITAVTNLTNMLEGFNGLGSGLGIIVTSTLIIISFITGQTDGLYLLIPLLGALCGFLYFNKYPSKIFPGDTLMFFQGATIGCAAFIGNLKTIAAILFLPMLVEFILKARGRFPAKNHGTIADDGTLTHEGKVFSLSHLLMKYSKLTEKRLVALLWMMEAILCTIMIVVVFLLGPEYAW